MSATNTRKLSGELLASYGGTNTRYYHFDALGSTVDVTDGAGSSVGSHAYGAWGTVAGTTGTTVYPYLYVGQLGYYTHTSDQGAEVQRWLNLGVRFYDPDIGRFERRDPLSTFLRNDLSYAAAKPLLLVDPSGKVCFRCWRELSGIWNWLAFGEQMHSFLWCPDKIKTPGKRRGEPPLEDYDPNDTVIGMGSDSICSDFDREYLNDPEMARAYGLECNELDPRLEKCLKGRAAKDMDRRCFKKYNPITNNCQEYTQDMIADCKRELASREKPTSK